MLPYPLLFVSLTVMWSMLNGFTPGHLLLGSIVALVASWGMASLKPAKPAMHKWYLLPKLIGIALYDIVISNAAVARIILFPSTRKGKPGFIAIPLQLRDRTGLAVLAVVLTSTPGSAWLEYNSSGGVLLLHVLDLDDEAAWIDVVRNRYEKLLMEIFE